MLPVFLSTQSSSDDSFGCGKHGEGYRLEVTTPMTRLDYFSGQFSKVLLTSIAVATAQEQTVASLGTTDGRLIQVGDTKGDTVIL